MINAPYVNILQLERELGDQRMGFPAKPSFRNELQGQQKIGQTCAHIQSAGRIQRSANITAQCIGDSDRKRNTGNGMAGEAVDSGKTAELKLHRRERCGRDEKRDREIA